MIHPNERVSTFPSSELAAAILAALLFLLPWIGLPGLNDRWALVRWTLLGSGAILLALLWSFDQLNRDSVLWFRTPLGVPLLAWLLILAVSSFRSIDRPASGLGSYGSYAYGVSTLLASILLFGMSFQFFSTDSAALRPGGSGPARVDPRKIQGPAILGGALMAALWTILERLKPGILPQNGGSVSWLFVSGAVPVSWAISQDARSSRRWAARGILAVIAAALAWDGPWTAILGCLAGTGAFLFLTRGSEPKKPLAAAGMVAGFLAILALVLIGPARERLAGLKNFSPDASARAQVLKSGVRIFLKRPFLGTGPDTFAIAFRKNKTLDYVRLRGPLASETAAGNEIVQQAATTGILGLGALLWIAVAFFRGTGRIIQTESNAVPAGCLGGVVAIVLCAQFQPLDVAAWSLLAVLSASLLSVGPEFRTGQWNLSPILSHSAKALVTFLAGTGLLFWARPMMADRQFVKARIAGLRDAALALQEYDSALRLNPFPVLYGYEKSQYCISQAMSISDLPLRRILFKKAADGCQENMDRHPHEAAGYWQMAAILMGASRLGEGNDYREPIRQCLERASQLDPLNADLWILKANFAAEIQDSSSEIIFLTQAAQIDPARKDVSNRIQELLNKEGKKTK